MYKPLEDIAANGRSILKKMIRVLVIGCIDKNIGIALKKQGIDIYTLPKPTIQDVLLTVRHEKFAGIVCQVRDLDIDILELVVNIRDIGVNIPFVVIGMIPNESHRKAYLSMAKTYMILFDSDSFRTLKLKSIFTQY